MDYLKLTEYYERLEKTSKRLEKTEILAELINKIPINEIENVIPLITGKTFNAYEESKTGISTKLVIKALAASTGNSTEKVEKLWSKIGDLGEVASELVKNKKQTTLSSKKLTVKKVIENVKGLALPEGKGSVEKKLGFIKEILTSAEPIEAKYVVRMLLEDLRIGVGEGVIRDSIVWAFYKDVKLADGKIEVKSREEYNGLVDKVQSAIDNTNDFSLIIGTIEKKGFKGLNELEVQIGKPFNVMLAIKAEDAQEAADAVGLPCLVDFKLDGFRVAVHNDGKNIKLFTRRLEDVTKQFPDVIEQIEKIKAKNFILDAEIIGIDQKGNYLPFQKISQRIKRKYEIKEIIKKIPVVISVFDILYLNGDSLFKKTQIERRKILEKTIPILKGKIEHTTGKTVKTVKEIEEFYKESLKKGNEGIMVKSVEKAYTPGRKVGGWVKLKPVLESLDLVILKAEWGTGKRGKQLSSFTVACFDDGKFVEVGKVSTGVKEKSEEGITYEEMTEILKPLIIEQKGKEVSVKPKIVIEVSYEEVQKSTNYNSGYALRFPRFIRLRDDKGVKDINNIKDIERIFKSQRGQK